MTPCSSIDVVLTGQKQLYRKELKGSLWGSMYFCGVKDEEHTGHGQLVEGSNCSLIFGACETASGVMSSLCSQEEGRC